MTFSLYDAVIPSNLQILGAVEGLVDKAEVYAAEKHMAAADMIERIGIVEDQRNEAEAGEERGKGYCAPGRIRERGQHLVVTHLVGQPVDAVCDERDDEKTRRTEDVEPVGQEQPEETRGPIFDNRTLIIRHVPTFDPR